MEASRRSGREALTLSLLAALLWALVAAASPAVATTTSYYVPKSPAAACRAGYERRVVDTGAGKHQTRCYPVASDYSVVAGHTLVVAAPGVLADAGARKLEVRLVSGAAHGKLTLGRTGGFTYTPDRGFSGTDQFKVRITGAGAAQREASRTVTVTINVTASGHAPGTTAGTGGSSGGSSGGTVTVTPAAPIAYNQIYPAGGTGLPGNTELQVGGTQASTPEVYETSSSNLLSGASDPGAAA
jgi:hypothetical protein